MWVHFPSEQILLQWLKSLVLSRGITGIQSHKGQVIISGHNISSCKVKLLQGFAPSGSLWEKNCFTSMQVIMVAFYFAFYYFTVLKVESFSSLVNLTKLCTIKQNRPVDDMRFKSWPLFFKLFALLIKIVAYSIWGKVSHLDQGTLLWNPTFVQFGKS